MIGGEHRREEYADQKVCRPYVHKKAYDVAMKKLFPFKIEKFMKHYYGIPREDIIMERKRFVTRTSEEKMGL